MEKVIADHHDTIDSYITVALENLKYDDEIIMKITLEVDRLMFEGDLSKIEKKAKKVNRRVFACCYSS